MTKQEIIDAIKSKCIPIYDDVVGYDFDWIADTLLAKIEQEKKDTLKEFVEWLKAKYKGQGLVMTLDDISRLLDSELEDFIKEKEL